MSNEHVGVNIKEGKSISSVSGVSTQIAGIIGNFVKGPLDKATLVTSFADFIKKFGDAPATGSTSWYSVKAFFAQTGNANLYVVRVAGTAIKASKTFQDPNVVDTLKVEALNEGAWGNKLSVDVGTYNILSTTLASDASSGETEATLVSIEGLEIGSYVHFHDDTNDEYVEVISIDTADKKIHWSGVLTNTFDSDNTTVTSVEFALKVYQNNVLVETWQGLTINDNPSFFCEKVINDVSNYITVTDLKDSDTDYQDLPDATSGAESLSGGADGLSDVIADDYKGLQSSKTGVYAFDEVDSLFRFCCPNPILTDADQDVAYKAVVQAMLDYADARVTVQYYADVQYNKSVSDAVTFAGNFTGRHAAMFYPWLKVYENSTPVWLPPSSFVLGAAVAKDYSRGVHKSIGNESLNYAIDLKYHVSISEGETLNDAKINTIRKFTGQGIKIYGGRTLSAVTTWRFLHCSELWNYLARSLDVSMQDVVFEPHNQLLWKTVTRRIEAFLAKEQQKGALHDVSNPQGTAYAVLMDETNNPSDQVALGIATVQVEYVPVGTVEKFIIELTSSPSGLTLSGTQG